MSKIVSAVFALLVMLAASKSAQATAAVNLVTNGDFELSTYGTGGSGAIATPVVGGSPITQNLTGWTLGYRTGSTTTPGLGFVFGSGQGDNPSNGGGAYLWGPNSGVSNGLTANSGATTTGGTSGGSYVALDGDPNVSGALSQAVSGLTPGAVYALTFDWATAELADTNFGVTTDQFQVSLGAQTLATQVRTTASKGFDPWLQVTMYFTATSASEVLAFLAVGSPSGEPPTLLLDAVSLIYAPEPSSLATMLMALIAVAGLAAARRLFPGRTDPG